MIGNFRKICGDQNFSEQYTIGFFCSYLFLGLEYLRHDALLRPLPDSYAHCASPYPVLTRKVHVPYHRAPSPCAENEQLVAVLGSQLDWLSKVTQWSAPNSANCLWTSNFTNPNYRERKVEGQN